MTKFKLNAKPTMHCDEKGISVNVNLSAEYLQWMMENVDPRWIAGALLKNDEVRDTIINVLLDKEYLELSTGKSFDERFREQLLDKAAKANYKALAHRLQLAIETAEKYTRVYWDWYHDAKPMHRFGDGSKPDVSGPEFFSHNEKPEHGWPSVRKDIEEKVLAVVEKQINAEN